MNRFWPVLLGVVIGVLGFATARFLVVRPQQSPHFHANFALFVDGARVDLSGDQYMQEVGSCTVGEEVLPVERAHLHNHDPDVVHVHHEGVTWGHLMANLGMGLGEDFLALSDGSVRVEGEARTLKFILNGQPEFAVHNELIESGDRLLISYGVEGEQEVLRTQFPMVAANAAEFNSRPDPAGCAGAEEATLWDRIRHAVAG